MIKSSFKILSVILFFAVSISFFSIGSCGSDGGGTGAVVNPCAGCIGTGAAGGCEPFQTSCATATNGICNDKEECIDPCGDGLKDGDETDIDCGGGTCKKCLQGKGCGANTDCNSQPNNQLYCVDNVCCTAPAQDCATECYSCSVKGAEGKCAAVPSGLADTEFCMGAAVCVNGQCSTNKTANGEPCTADSDCASNRCVDNGMGTKVCKQDNGTPCADASVCASGKCTNDLCQ